VSQIRINNKTRELNSPLVLKECSSFFSKFAGLMFKKNLKEDDGIILFDQSEGKISSSVHMFFMNFDLGIIWLDSGKRVVDTRYAKKWHPFYAPASSAQFTLEIHPTRIKEFFPNDQVEFVNEN